MVRLFFLLISISLAGPCIAVPFQLPFFSISTPSNWDVTDLTGSGSGSILTQRDREEPAPQLIISYCQWKQIFGCLGKDCGVESVQKNVGTQLPRGDRRVVSTDPKLIRYEYSEAGNYDGTPVWLVASYSCTRDGVVFVLAISMASKSEASELAAATVSTIEWREPRLTN